MSMGVDVGYGAGIAPHPGPLPKGAREKGGAYFPTERSCKPTRHLDTTPIGPLSLWERVRVRVRELRLRRLLKAAQ